MNVGILIGKLLVGWGGCFDRDSEVEVDGRKKERIKRETEGEWKNGKHFADRGGA